MTKLIIYINDNEIQIIKDKIITFTSSSISDSNIKEENLFLKEFKKFLKDNKLISSIIYYPINIYLNYKIFLHMTLYNFLLFYLTKKTIYILCI